MFGLLGSRRKMVGGLYFGPAAWRPELLETVTTGRALLRVPAGAEAGPMGRRVRKGEVIAAGTEGEADVLAPFDGLIVGRQRMEDAVHGSCDGVLLKAASAEEAPPDEAKTRGAIEAAEMPGLVDALRGAGIGQTSVWVPGLLAQMWDLGGVRARAIVLNMMPAEPESALNHGLSMLEMPRLLAGLQWLRRAVSAKRTIVALDRHDLRSRRAWRKGLRRQGVQMARLLNRYPQAHPTVLLRTLLGYKLAAGALPTSTGVVMVDAVTLWALGGHLLHGEKFLRRPVEVFCAGRMPRIVLAPVGMVLEDLAGFCGQEKEGRGDRQCIVNGMLAGVDVDPEHSAVGGATASVSIRTVPLAEEPAACIQCGWCVDHCPTALAPVRLHDLARSPRGPKSDEAGEALHCIGCGLCSYVCPSRLPLTPQVVALRGRVRGRREEAAAVVKADRVEGGAA